MVDINNIELQVGDSVVYTYAKSGFLNKGIIHKFTKQGVSIKYVQHWTDWKTHQPMSAERTINLLGANGRIMKV